jgi:hypothetical protein
MRRQRKIPGRDAWSGYEDDLDAKYAHKLLFGKSTADVQALFGGVRSIERASELLFVPRPVFQYYVFAFAEFVISDRAVGDSDSASPFLRLLVNREERDPGSVAEVYSDLQPLVEFVASHQERYDADPNIYGSFPDLAAQLKRLCEASASRPPNNRWRGP